MSAEKMFRIKSKALHPDAGGDARELQRLSAAYDAAKRQVAA